MSRNMVELTDAWRRGCEPSQLDSPLGVENHLTLKLVQWLDATAREPTERWLVTKRRDARYDDSVQDAVNRVLMKWWQNRVDPRRFEYVGQVVARFRGDALFQFRTLSTNRRKSMERTRLSVDLEQGDGNFSLDNCSTHSPQQSDVEGYSDEYRSLVSLLLPKQQLALQVMLIQEGTTRDAVEVWHAESGERLTIQQMYQVFRLAKKNLRRLHNPNERVVRRSRLYGRCRHTPGKVLAV